MWLAVDQRSGRHCSLAEEGIALADTSIRGLHVRLDAIDWHQHTACTMSSIVATIGDGSFAVLPITINFDNSCAQARSGFR